MKPLERISITCVYCRHTWNESVDALEKEQRVIYREETADDSPVHTAEYLVTCPNCGRRNVVTVQIRGG